MPKQDLIAAAQVALQTKRLRIASGLPSARLLIEELAAYRVKVSEDGMDSYGNVTQPNPHVWLGSRTHTPSPPLDVRIRRRLALLTRSNDEE